MNAYFDTSALVKLVVTEVGSDFARSLWDSAEITVTSRVTYVEARAALAAAWRAGRLTHQTPGESRQALDGLFREMDVVEVDVAITRTGGDLAEEHGLRGYDAVHLASSLTLGDEAVMVTWNRDLAWAAHRSGLDLAGISLE